MSKYDNKNTHHNYMCTWQYFHFYLMADHYISCRLVSIFPNRIDYDSSHDVLQFTTISIIFS